MQKNKVFGLIGRNIDYSFSKENFSKKSFKMQKIGATWGSADNMCELNFMESFSNQE